MNNLKRLFGVLLGVTLLLPAYAQYADDEFNSTVLSPQWSFHDSDPTGSTYSLDGSNLKLKAKEGADMYFFIDKYTYMEQEAPTGTNWEIVTKISGFDPTQSGFQNNWNKTGLMLWQDNDHWFGVWLMGNDGVDGGGWDRWIEGAYNSDFVANRVTNWGEWGGDQAYRNILPDPVWIKIQKTEFGYFGLYSLDGTNWIQVNRMIRNSQNPDGNGYFTNEKLRIIQSGPGTNGTNATASFDFVRKGNVTVQNGSPGTDDEFNGTALNSSLWGTYQGVNVSEVKVEDGKLKITPANFNDQWGGIDKAVRVYQRAPNLENFQVTVKVGPNAIFDYQDWSGYGMMLWQDQNDYVLLANVRTNDGSHMIQSAFQRQDALAWNVYEQNIGSTLLPEYLRIKKEGLVYTASYSNDSTTFTDLNPGGTVYPVELKNPQVQLFGKKINAQGGPQLTAEFDWVKFENLSSEINEWTIY